MTSSLRLGLAIVLVTGVVATVAAKRALNGQRTASAETVVPLAPERQTADIRIVSFLQGRASRRMLGGAAAPLTLPAGARH